MDYGAVLVILGSSLRFRANSKANQTFYAFIAAIIAGMPMMFMTRVML